MNGFNLNNFCITVKHIDIIITDLCVVNKDVD